MIEKINNVLLEERFSPSANNMINKISETLSIKFFREELKELFDQFEIERKWLSIDNIFKEFMGTICAVIINQPLSFPADHIILNTRRIAKIKERIANLVKSEIADEEARKKWTIESVKLIYGDENSVKFKITTEAQIFLQGPLMF